MCKQSHAIVQDLHRWLGADFAAAKLQKGTSPIILGAEYNLTENILEVTSQRREDLQDMIRHYTSE